MTHDGAAAGRPLLFALLALALALRLLVLYEVRELPGQLSLIEDAARYDRLARELPRHGWLPPGAFDQAPLYPYWLAAVYAVNGASYGTVRVLQAGVDVAALALLAAAARRRFTPRVALATVGLGALYGPLVFQSTLLLKETLATFAVAAIVWLLAADSDPPSRHRVFLAGLALGAAAQLRENLLLLAPFLLVWVAWETRSLPRARRLVVTLVMIAGVTVPLLPTLAINRKVSGQWLVTSYQGGMNFLIGNARGGNGSYRPLFPGSQDPEQERADARALAAALLGRGGQRVDPERLTPRQVSRALWGAAWDDMAAEPLQWARLMLRKMRLFWNAYEIPDAEGLSTYRAASPALRSCFVGFGWILPLMVIGASEARARGWPFYLIAAGLFVSVVVFFVFGRYRLPVVAALLPLAGHGLASLPGLLRSASRRRALLTLGAAAMAGVLAWLPAWSDDELRRHEAVLRFNQGSAGINLAESDFAAGKLDGAVRAASTAAGYMQSAIAAQPGLLRAYLGQAAALHREGFYLARLGDSEGARRSYDAALAALSLARRSPAWDDGAELAGEASRLEAVIRDRREGGG